MTEPKHPPGGRRTGLRLVLGGFLIVLVFGLVAGAGLLFSELAIRDGQPDGYNVPWMRTAVPET